MDIDTEAYKIEGPVLYMYGILIPKEAAIKLANDTTQENKDDYIVQEIIADRGYDATAVLYFNHHMGLDIIANFLHSGLCKFHENREPTQCDCQGYSNGIDRDNIYLGLSLSTVPIQGLHTHEFIERLKALKTKVTRYEQFQPYLDTLAVRPIRYDGGMCHTVFRVTILVDSLTEHLIKQEAYLRQYSKWQGLGISDIDENIIFLCSHCSWPDDIKRKDPFLHTSAFATAQQLGTKEDCVIIYKSFNQILRIYPDGVSLEIYIQHVQAELEALKAAINLPSYLYDICIRKIVHEEPAY